MSNINPVELRDRLESLPQELYDHIFDLTFTADDQVHHITTRHPTMQDYHNGDIIKSSNIFPHLLHVSRNTRDTFAKSYYSNPAGFALYEGTHLSPTHLHKWLKSIPKPHAGLLCKVEVSLRPNGIMVVDRGALSCYHDAVWWNAYFNDAKFHEKVHVAIAK